MSTLLESVSDVILSVQTELAVFVIAIFAHMFLFGSYHITPRKPKKLSGLNDSTGASPSSSKRSPALTPAAVALMRTAKRLSQQGARREALVQELGAKVRATPADDVCPAFVAALEGTGKTLNADLINAVRDTMSEHDLALSSSLGEHLLRNYFALGLKQEFQEVLAGLEASDAASPASMVFALRSALDGSDFNGAMRYLRRLGALKKTASVPHQVVQKLVQAAIQKDALEELLHEFAACGFLSASILEVAIVEYSQRLSKEGGVAVLEQLEKLARTHHVGLTDRASAVLIRAACTAEDVIRVFTDICDRGSVGKESILAALDFSTIHADKAIGKLIIQRLPNVLAPEVSAALLQAVAEGPLHDQDAESTVLGIYSTHMASASSVLTDLRTGRIIAEAALRKGRGDVLEQLACAASHAEFAALVKSFGNAGHLNDAMTVFRACHQKAACLYASILDACIGCQDINLAEQILEEAVDANMADTASFNVMIKALLQSGSAPRAHALMKKMPLAGGSCAPNIVTFNEMIDAAIRRQGGDAQDLLQEMKAYGIKPTSVTCSIIFKGIQRGSKASEVDRAIAFIDEMDGPMDEIVLCSLCEACKRAGRADLLANELYRFHGIVAINSARAYGSIIRAYGFLNDIHSARKVWCEMRQRNLVPTDVTIGCMTEALASNGLPEEGYALIRELSADERTRPLLNVVVYCSVLKGFTHQKNFNRVWHVYDEMIQAKLQFSIVTFNAVIDACARSCQMIRVQPLLEDMERQGITPNIVTYSTILKGYCQEGRLNEAFQLLKTMKLSEDVKPDEFSYNTLIDGCAQRGLYDQGMKLLAEMQQAGVAPSVFTLTVLVKLATRSRQPQKAFEIVEELSSKYHIQLNSHVYANLIHACTSYGELTRAVQVVEQMGWQRVRPDVRSYTLLIRAFLEAKQFNNAVGFVHLACGVQRALPPLLAGLAPAAGCMRLKGGLPQDLLKETMEALVTRGVEHVAVQLCKDLRAVPGLNIDPKLSLSLTSRAIRTPTAAWPTSGARGR